MFEQLAKLVPQNLLEDHFRSYVPEVIKFRHHLRVLACCMVDTPRQETDLHFLHYGACFDTWNAIWRSLGLKSNVAHVEREWVGCSYPRCASIIGVAGFGVPFGCPGCGMVAYCNTRCQAQ